MKNKKTIDYEKVIKKFRTYIISEKKKVKNGYRIDLSIDSYRYFIIKSGLLSDIHNKFNELLKGE